MRSLVRILAPLACGAIAGLAAIMLVALLAMALYGATVAGPTAPDGTEIQIDLPQNLQRRNTSSRGEGCCVFTSIHHAALWQDVPALQEFPKWLQAKGLSGGGYPGNVKARITAICKDRNVAEPEYIQVQGRDLEILKLATKTGRLPAVTYSRSPTGRYNGGTIAHMVNLPHATDSTFAVLDNNYLDPGKNIEWMSPAEFQKYPSLGGDYWAVILLNQGPPPCPTN